MRRSLWMAAVDEKKRQLNTDLNHYRIEAKTPAAHFYLPAHNSAVLPPKPCKTVAFEGEKEEAAYPVGRTAPHRELRRWRRAGRRGGQGCRLEAGPGSRCPGGRECHEPSSRASELKGHRDVIGKGSMFVIAASYLLLICWSNLKIFKHLDAFITRNSFYSTRRCFKRSKFP